MTETPDTCDVCRLVDPYNGQGDGLGSCDCPRCEGGCGVAADSVLCSCPPDDELFEPWPAGVLLPDDQDDRPIETVPTRGLL